MCHDIHGWKSLGLKTVAISFSELRVDLAVIGDDDSYLDSHQVFCHTPIQVTVLQWASVVGQGDGYPVL